MLAVACTHVAMLSTPKLKGGKDFPEQTLGVSQHGLPINKVVVSTPPGVSQSCFPAFSISFTSEDCLQRCCLQPAHAEGLSYLEGPRIPDTLLVKCHAAMQIFHSCLDWHL